MLAQHGRAYITSDVLGSAFALVMRKVEEMVAAAPVVLAAFIFLTTLSVLLYYDYNLARKNGFRYPGAISLVATFWIAALALAHAVYFQLPESFQLPENDYLFFSFLFLIALIIAPAFKLVLRALPTRSARIYGERHSRVPFTLLGIIVILVSCVAVLNGIGVGVLGILPGVYMIRLARRLKSPQVPALLPGDKEPIGALYLRPFRHERQYFVYGDRGKYRIYTDTLRASITPLYGGTPNIGVRFDEYFRSAVTSSVGPFVALGNPEDYIPPGGASRLYAKDSDWKERLNDFAKRASWILVELGSSDHLSWEFDHLRREGLQQKMFIITPPAREAAGFVWWFIDFNRYINRIGTVSWRKFCEGIEPLGYEVDRTDPGPGAIITFDSNAKSILLIRNAKTPEEFVGAIRAWTKASG